MGMTMEDKEKCAELFEIFTGIYTEPSRWNEEAGDLLAEMVHKIKECSSGMGMARSVWPSTSKITWLWLAAIPFHIIRNEIKIKAGAVKVACLNVGVDVYEELIQIALMK